MKLRSIAMAALLCCGSIAFAQVCPAPSGSVCLVPPRNVAQANQIMIGQSPILLSSTAIPAGTTLYQLTPVQVSSAGGVSTVYQLTPVQIGTTGMPIASAACAPGVSTAYQLTPVQIGTTGTPIASAACPAGVSPDTACLLNQVASLQSSINALRGDMYASSLTTQGMELTSRLNQLMAQEMAFRQQIAANPNLPSAQLIATDLEAQANALNRDIASFNRELASVPVSMRPLMATRLNTFDQAYWTPTLQRFAEYRSNFPQAVQSSYQVAFNTVPSLQPWTSNFQTSLNDISVSASAPTTTTVASANWWTQPQMQVAGSTEVFPAGMINVPQGYTAMQMSDGSIILVPQGFTMVPMTGTSGTPPSMMMVPSGMSSGQTY